MRVRTINDLDGPPASRRAICYLSTGTEETNDIGLTVEIATARKTTLYREIKLPMMASVDTFASCQITFKQLHRYVKPYQTHRTTVVPRSDGRFIASEPSPR
jgi:hypothetical protein